MTVREFSKSFAASARGSLTLVTLVAAVALIALWPAAADGQEDQHAVQVVEVTETTIAISWQDAGASYYGVAWWPLDYSSFKSALAFAPQHTITGLQAGVTYTVDVSGVGKRNITTLSAGPPQQQPELTIKSGPNVVEGGSAAFTLSADPKPAAALTVRVNVNQSGAYGVRAGAHLVSIPTGGSATLILPTTDDSTDEANGSVTATLQSGQGYTVSATQGAATIAISDDDDPPPSDPVISITGGLSVSEGGPAIFAVTASPAPSADLTVRINVTQQGDFGVTTGVRTTTIPVGGSTTLTVGTTDDSIDEASGSVMATLAGGNGYSVSVTQGAATVVVTDDDDPPPSDPVVSITGGVGVSEGSPAIFTVTASPAPSADLTVSLNVTQQGDFTASTGSQNVTIPPTGAVTVAVSTIDDSTDEANGSVTATLASGSGYTVSGTQAAATIAVSDDDDPPLQQQDDDPEHDPEHDLEQRIQERIDLTVRNGDKWSERIWRRALATVRGETPPNGWDPISEAQAERIADSHRGRGNTELADLWQAIFDHIAGVSTSVYPVISIGAGSGISEGGDATFTVSANPTPAATLSVSISVTQLGDFGVTTGSHAVSIPTSGNATLTISTADDSADEADGSVTATIVAGSAYDVSAAQGTATVAVSDNDVPEISISATTGISEGGNAAFTVSANPTPAATLTVTVKVTQTGDFGVNSGAHSLTIPTGGSATLTIPTTDDSIDEADGSVTATLATGGGYTVSSTQGAATVAVTDDDDPPQQQKDGDPVHDLEQLIQERIDLTVRNNDRWSERIWRRALATVRGETPPNGWDPISEIQAERIAGSHRSRGNTELADLWQAIFDHITGASTNVHPVISISASGDVGEGGDASFTLSANPPSLAAVSVSVSITQIGDYGVSTGTYTVSIPAGGSATLAVSTTDDEVEEADGSVTATLVAGADYVVSATQGAATVAVADDDSSSVGNGSVSGGTLGDAFVDSLQDAMQRTASAQQSAQSSDLAVQQDAQSTERAAQQAVQQQLDPPFTGTSVVYVVDDSGSMDGDWPEVRTALREVRDMSGVTDTRVALISFGFLHPTVLFGLTDHASAPWDTPLSGYTGKKEYLNGLTRIETFGGFKGGTAYTDPLRNALQLFSATPDATTRKIVFMSDAQAARSDRYPTEAITEISTAGIIIDTVYFGNHYSDLNSDLQKMSTDTGGSHSDVMKPSTGTTNDPAVTARALEDILVEKAAANTTTLYLVDSSFSLMPRTEHGSLVRTHILSALEAVETKVVGISTARAGVARFLGRNEIADFDYQIEVNGVVETRTHDEDDRYEEPYMLEVAFNTGSAFDLDVDEFWLALTGSTELDQALDMAHTSISAESGTTKRVVLITDGITPSKPTAATLQEYVDDGILLDVVALGGHADRVYLKSIADTNSTFTFNVAITPSDSD